VTPVTPVPTAEVTELGIRYAQASESAKEELSLELLQCFHSYLMKYLDMIVRGHLPRYGGRVNDDSKKLLVNLLPKGTEVTQQSLMHACRHLHLAFKGYEPAEIYNVLATVLLRITSKYGPGLVVLLPPRIRRNRSQPPGPAHRVSTADLRRQ
jgi:hypothetical protein